MKVLVGMNLSPRWVESLRTAGLEAEHWSKVGRADAPDSEIMAYAAANNSVVLTHDLDLGAILATTHGTKPSVAQLRSGDVGPEAIGARVAAALHHVKTELEAGALLTIDAERTRLRLLPLRRSD